ncbi:unnamed protein product [Cylicocyclus nassatus]|uniref:Uncharacterized protein n=1 Tax=Cylicocyclus nassatus TaxID=53992 RepID=A0AA36H1R6_CYLNA|nr:unnamed protein product [Cylicocyclus nassatus]
MSDLSVTGTGIGSDPTPTGVQSGSTGSSVGDQHTPSGQSKSKKDVGVQSAGTKSDVNIASKTQFLFAAMAFAFGAENTWVVPSYVGKSGMVFIIQFAICYLLAAVPMLYLEIAMGQFTSASPFSIYQMMSPAMGGVPAGMCFLLIIRSVAISVWASEALVLFLASMKGLFTEVPWTKCGDFEDCYDYRLASRCLFASPNDTVCQGFINAMVITRSDHIRNSALASYVHAIVQENEEITAQRFMPHWFLLVSLFLIWLMACAGASVGIRFLSKTAYLAVALAVISTITFFFIALLVGNVRQSIMIFMQPPYNLLLSVERWIVAAGHALIALNVSTGGMIKLASSRGFHMGIVWDVVIIASVVLLYHALTLAAIVMFMEKFAAQVYPFDDPKKRFIFVTSPRYMPLIIIVEVFMTMPLSWLLSALHFLARLIIPMQTLMTNVWVVVTMLREKYADSTKKHLSIFYVWLLLILLCICGYIVSCMFIMPGGLAMSISVQMISGFSSLIIGFLQLVTVAYIYGFRRFSVNIRTMTEAFGPMNFFWWFNWIITSPFLHLACFVATFTVTYKYMWEQIFWRIVFSVTTVAWVPLNLFYKNRERKHYNEKFKTMFRPRKDWGPSNVYDREQAIRMERALRVR